MRKITIAKKANDLALPFLVIMIAVTFMLTTSLWHRDNQSLSKPNYLGLAMLGSIPSSNTCHHDKESYFSSNIVMQDGDEDNYLIIISKFGDESCIRKI